MEAPRIRREAPRELTASDLLRKPTQTLAQIFDILDSFLYELQMRVREGSASAKDIKSFTELVKAHATLRQTQLAEDQFARTDQSVATDADVAMLLIEAIKAGGPGAEAALRAAVAEMPERERVPAGSPELKQGPGQSHETKSGKS